ncbi:hypothetical protein J1TS3_18790 [Siminovitchia fordii]|uniref:Uncharacterized protein n=1 Tax=Siminovitchia fordii TaxID=254759 RepID=A0ABQ4K6C6_9BACI|nr:hypothetical protein J1TS3_18790 [Siminovitchia fordii]
MAWSFQVAGRWNWQYAFFYKFLNEMESGFRKPVFLETGTFKEGDFVGTKNSRASGSTGTQQAARCKAIYQWTVHRI